jgi:hypothetical protein
MARNRRKSADARGGGRTGSRPGPQFAGLRWVPVPLAALMALVGWLVLGAAAGQHAAANARQSGYEASGIAMTVDQELWMSNDMTGQGPLNSKTSDTDGFAMAQSMMPGMQSPSNDRLHIQLNLANATKDAQHYSLDGFRVVGPGGKSWPNSDSGGITPAATLAPGFEATVNLYFDIPDAQSGKNLTVKWSRGGKTLSFPVNTSGTGLPGPMHM